MERDKIKPFVDSVIYQALSDANAYRNISKQAYKLIKGWINYDVEGTAEEWIIYPYSLVVQYLAQNLISHSDEVFQKKIQQQYQEAKEIFMAKAKTNDGITDAKNIIATELANNDKY